MKHKMFKRAIVMMLALAMLLTSTGTAAFAESLNEEAASPAAETAVTEQAAEVNDDALPAAQDAGEKASEAKDSELTAKDWEAKLPSKISDDAREAMAQVAKSQNGSDIALYKAFANADSLKAGDASFVMFALEYANVLGVRKAIKDDSKGTVKSGDLEFPVDADTDAWIKALKKAELYTDRNEENMPKQGDIVFVKGMAAVVTDAADDGSFTLYGQKKEKDGEVSKYSADVKDIDGFVSLKAIAADKIADEEAAEETAAEAEETAEDAEAVENAEELTEEEKAAEEAKKAEEAAKAEEEAKKAEAEAAGLSDQTVEAKITSAPGVGGKLRSLFTSTKGTEITISGMLPEDATVKAYPVSVDIPGQNVLTAYDITIYTKDENGKEVEWQPTEPLSVSIKDAKLGGSKDTESEKSYKVFHMADENAKPEEIGTPTTVASADGNNAVVFTAESFSIYVISEGDEEDEPSYIYLFVDPDGMVYYRQQVKEGGQVTVPAEPSVKGKVFRGWFNTYIQKGTGEEDVWEDPFEAMTITGIPDDSVGENTRVFTVYGRFDNTAYISFYNQDGKTVEKLLDCKIGEQVKMDANHVQYTPIPSGNTYYKFLGWTASSDLSDRFPSSEASADPQEDFTATEDRTFYPILLSGHYVYFNTNATGSGVKYIEPEFLEGTTTPAAPAKPERAGWQFDGWYDAASGGTQVFDANGVKKVNTYDGGINDNLTLYAHWTGLPTKMTVVWWVQNSRDKAGLPDNEKTYDFVNKIEYRTAEDGSSIISGDSVAANNERFTEPSNYITGDDPDGFVYNYDKSDHDSVEVEGDGSTTFNIYFDRKTFHLVFVDQAFSSTKIRQSDLATKDKMAQIDALYGEDLTNYWPLENSDAKVEGSGKIGQIWSWRADSMSGEEVTPESLTKAFKTIVKMPLVNEGRTDATVYFAHNTVQTAKGYSHSYVELDPDASLAQVEQDYNAGAEVPNWPGVKKYVKTGNTYYEHRLTQGHAFDSGSSDPTNPTNISYGGFFFNIDGFSQLSSTPKYYTYSVSGGGRREKASYTYTESTDDDAKPYDITRTKAQDVGEGGNPSKDLRYSPDIQNMIHYYKRDTDKHLRVMVKWDTRNPYEMYDQETPFEKDISEKFLNSKLKEYLNSNPDHIADLVDGKIPDYMEFTGWYTDEDLTQQVIDFSKLEMPSDNLTLYAGIQKKWYLVNIDPNGGEIHQEKNWATWLWREYGDTSLSRYDIERNYVKDPNGNYSYVCYTRGYSDTKVRKAEYVLTSSIDDSLRGKPGVTIEDGYSLQNAAYVLVGWYELDHIESDGTKVLKDTPYAFGSQIDHSFTLVAKWRRNATYKISYSSDAVDEAGYTYTITPPTDDADYVDGAGAVVKAPAEVPEGKRIKCWKLSDSSTVKVNENIRVRDEVSETIRDDDVARIKQITLTAVLEDDPGSGDIGGSATDVRHYWFINGQEGSTDEQMREYYQTIHTNSNYEMATPAGQEHLREAAYYVQNISPGEELVVPTPPTDPSGQGRPFLGWYTDSGLTHAFSGFGTVASPLNTKLYASFDPGWQVIYKDKDGNIIGKQNYSKSGSAKLVTYGVTYTPEDGSMMLGWSSNQNDTVPVYNYNDINAQSLAIERNMTLYAVTGYKQYLYFDVNGGSNYVDPVVLPADKRPDAPATEASRPGYNFAGWFTEPDGGTRYHFGRGDQLPAGITKLYAHWQISSHSSVDASYKVIWWVPQDNGSYAFSNEITESNGVFVADRIDPKQYGNLTSDNLYASAIDSGRAYYSIHHATDGHGTTLYSIDNDANVTTDNSLIVEDHDSEINIYLRKTSDAAITFDANGGKFADNNSNYQITGITLGEDLTEEWPASPTREGCYFTGWTTGRTGNGTPYSAGEATADLLDARTLYAQWTTADQPAVTEDPVYKLKITHKFEGRTDDIVEYYDIDKNAYDAIVDDSYGTNNFSSYRKSIDGYTYYSTDNVTSDDDTTGTNGSKVVSFTYEYSWMYSGRLWWVQPFVTKEANFRTHGSQYDSWQLYNDSDTGLKNIVLYKSYSGRGTPLSNYKGSDPVQPDDYMDGIQRVQVPTAENVTPPESELIQENDYIRQVATPIFGTVYHPGVISVTMHYKKDPEPQFRDTYNLTFKDLEGGNTTVSQVYEENDPISPVSLASAPDNKVFEHWSENVNGEPYSFSTMPSHDVTLYAVWQTQAVNVTTQNTHCTDSGAAVYNGKRFSGDKGSALGTFEIPDPLTHEDGGKLYIFDYWSLTENGTKLNLSEPVVENTTIYAVWKEKPATKYVNVYYDKNDGEAISAEDVDTKFPGTELVTGFLDSNRGRYKDTTNYIAGGSPAALSANLVKEVVVDGKTRTAKFVCWTTNPDGSGQKYYPGQNIRLSSEDIVLYASYSSYRETTLSYDINTTESSAKLYEANVTGSGSDESWERTSKELDPQSVVIKFKDYLDLTADDVAAQEANTPYVVGVTQDNKKFVAFRPGYKFKGWSDDPNADPAGTYIQPGTKIKVDTKKAENNTLYAIWEEIKLPVEVYEVTLGDYSNKKKVSLKDSQIDYLFATADRTENATNTANTWYNTAVRNDLAAGDIFGKATIGASNTKIDFVRFNSEENAWQYAIGESQPDPDSNDWTDFVDYSLRLYYYPEKYDVTVHTVIMDNNSLTQVTSENYSFTGEPTADQLATAIWNSGSNLDPTAAEKLKNKNGTDSNYVLNGFALGPKTLATSSASFYSGATFLKPLLMQNTVDGILYGNSSDDDGLVQVGTCNDKFAVYIVYKELSVGTLTVTNHINPGTYTNANEKFTVKVTFTKTGTADVIENETPKVNGAAIQRDGKTCSYTTDQFAEGSDIVITDIPIGWSYEVEETDNKGYTVAFKNSEADQYVESSDKKTTGTITEASHTVYVQNSRDSVPFTGIISKHSPIFAIIVMLILGEILLVGYLKRRRRGDA